MKTYVRAQYWVRLKCHIFSLSWSSVLKKEFMSTRHAESIQSKAKFLVFILLPALWEERRVVLTGLCSCCSLFSDAADKNIQTPCWAEALFSYMRNFASAAWRPWWSRWISLKELWGWSDFSLSKWILFGNKFNFSQVTLPVMVTGNLPTLITAQELFPIYCLLFSWVRKGMVTEWLKRRHRVWKDCSKPFLGWCKNAELQNRQSWFQPGEV